MEMVDNLNGDEVCVAVSVVILMTER